MQIELNTDEINMIMNAVYERASQIGKMPRHEKIAKEFEVLGDRFFEIVFPKK